MGWRQFITNYLTFTRKDRIGLFVMIGLILVVLLAPRFTSKFASNPQLTAADSSWIPAARKLESTEPVEKSNPPHEDNSSHYQYDRSVTSNSRQASGELFYFDPNHLSAEEWEKLGLRERTIRTIQNYLSKGGHFYKAEDLSKIYGLQKEEYKRLEPYIRIREKDNIPTLYRQTDAPVPYPARTERYKAIDINLADTAALIALPGIGSKLAARIVNFRDKLGGFYSVNQVGETFGLPDSTFQKIRQYLKLENTTVRKININTASVDELKTHPYIKYSLANPIVAYRNEHGPFSKVEEVKKVMAVTEEVYIKIVPYLAVQ